MLEITYQYQTIGEFTYGSITNTDQYPAQAFSSVLDRFVYEFNERTNLGKLDEILTKLSKDLMRKTVEQRPETFTEKHLIIPGLEALGYSIHRKHPGEFVSDDQSEPDFSITTGHAPNTYLVEAKKLASMDRKGSGVSGFRETSQASLKTSRSN